MRKKHKILVGAGKVLLNWILVTRGGWICENSLSCYTNIYVTLQQDIFKILSKRKVKNSGSRKLLKDYIEIWFFTFVKNKCLRLIKIILRFIIWKHLTFSSVNLWNYMLSISTLHQSVMCLLYMMLFDPEYVLEKS